MAGELERGWAWGWAWPGELCSCWYSSLDSFSWDSLLCSMSVEDATAGLGDSSEEMGALC